jgi:ribosome-associated heat shock protein Hsp15
MMGLMEKVRIDKWLWAVRMFKTRSMASDACTGGHVKVSGETVKSSKGVVVGDMIDVLTPGGPRSLEVAGLADKRGPAKVAVTLYVDHTPPPPSTEHVPGDPTFDRGSRKGRKGPRPTKRDRRKFKPDKAW